MLLSIVSYSMNVVAGGVALGSTRVIYPIGAKEVPLAVNNTDDSIPFLIQTWVSKEDGSKARDFIVTPPLFVIKPNKENTLRIMYAGPDLPQDRESVFYLNSKAIPSVDQSKLKGNNLQIATQSVLKVFMRPKNLPVPSIDAPKGLRCSISGGTLVVSNPSPYYVSLVQLYVGGKKQPNAMAAPKGDTRLSLTGGESGEVTLQTVNDYGANTPKQICLAK
ncbi:fimbria/pilus periplasmic chaperone [Enterobacter ludwigii]|nr:fimbria/pilus periplasmic chaperone [Enterobacter ludwigii]QLA09276.1 fimbria/pilus periplasmic chaperone [Enterobacter ludwigii]